jgi:uncharacterized membrane protein
VESALAITTGFVAIAGLLAGAKDAPERALNLGLAAVTIVLAWTVTQVGLHASLRARVLSPGRAGLLPKGSIFGGTETRTATGISSYFATSIDAASQTSDVSILTKPLRRLATLHAIISFFFNAAVLALTINLGASLI